MPRSYSVCNFYSSEWKQDSVISCLHIIGLWNTSATRAVKSIYVRVKRRRGGEKLWIPGLRRLKMLHFEAKIRYAQCHYEILKLPHNARCLRSRDGLYISSQPHLYFFNRNSTVTIRKQYNALKWFWLVPPSPPHHHHHHILSTHHDKLPRSIILNCSELK